MSLQGNYPPRPSSYAPLTPQPTPAPNPTVQNNGMFTRNLIGSLSASAFKLTDPDNKIGVWFILQDLSVRTEGSFRLKMNFVNVGDGNSGVNTKASPILATAFSDVFQVYSAKKFPGVIESTPLSKCFAVQGTYFWFFVSFVYNNDISHTIITPLLLFTSLVFLRECTPNFLHPPTSKLQVARTPARLKTRMHRRGLSLPLLSFFFSSHPHLPPTHQSKGRTMLTPPLRYQNPHTPRPRRRQWHVITHTLRPIRPVSNPATPCALHPTYTPSHTEQDKQRAEKGVRLDFFSKLFFLFRVTLSIAKREVFLRSKRMKFKGVPVRRYVGGLVKVGILRMQHAPSHWFLFLKSIYRRSVVVGKRSREECFFLHSLVF